MKICSICNDTKKVINTDIGLLCNKHYQQYKRHGKILERTTYDKNKINLFENYAELEIYDVKGNIKFTTIIDLDIIDKISDKKWCANTNNYIISGFTTPFTYLHRFIINAQSEDLVDHINGNILDNRKINLRICNTTENAQNKTIINSLNTSGITGVHWDKSRNKWKVEIGIDGKNKYIGRYDNLEDAKLARLNAEEVYYKQFKPIKNETYKI